MLTMFRASRSNVIVWILLGLLIVGLAGFGITTGGGGGRTVAQVGDARIEADTLARALDQELSAISRQIGRTLPMSEARQFGVDRMVLARLINDATLDDEAARLGLSTGDATVQRMVMATPAFRGTDGTFDRAAYGFALERTGMTPAEFETLLRAEATRELIAGSVQGAARMPETAATTILDYIGETRRIAWIELGADLLADPVPAPDAAALEAFHAENAARYTRPETRRITYALLDPAALAATIELTDAELRAAYEAERGRFDIPERRILDRIGFATTEEAAAARARIEAGEADFDAIAAERGLGPDAIDLGEQTRADLSPEAGEAVFAAPEPGVVGPAATPLGPSLFRINAILAASVTPFEAAREDLEAELALEAARAQVADAAAPVEDLIAGGARLEEVAAETEFELGTLALDAATTGGLADDAAFREAAEAAEPGVETDLVELASGGLAALRVDAVEPPALIPLEEVRGQVAADWTAAETARLLQARAEEFAAEIEGGLTLADVAARLGREVQTAGPLGRADLLPEAPAGLVEAAFAAPPQVMVVRSEPGRSVLAQVAEVIPFAADTPQTEALETQVTEEIRMMAAEDILSSFVQALQLEAGVSVNQELFEQVLAQFP